MAGEEQVFVRLEVEASGDQGFYTRPTATYRMSKSSFRKMERAILQTLMELGVKAEEGGK